MTRNSPVPVPVLLEQARDVALAGEASLLDSKRLPQTTRADILRILHRLPLRALPSNMDEFTRRFEMTYEGLFATEVQMDRLEEAIINIRMGAERALAMLSAVSAPSPSRPSNLEQIPDSYSYQRVLNHMDLPQCIMLDRAQESHPWSAAIWDAETRRETTAGLMAIRGEEKPTVTAYVLRDLNLSEKQMRSFVLRVGGHPETPEDVDALLESIVFRAAYPMNAVVREKRGAFYEALRQSGFSDTGAIGDYFATGQGYAPGYELNR